MTEQEQLTQLFRTYNEILDNHTKAMNLLADSLRSLLTTVELMTDRMERFEQELRKDQ